MHPRYWSPVLAGLVLFFACSRAKEASTPPHIPCAPDSFAITDLVPKERYLVSTDTRAYVKAVPDKPKSVTLIKKDAGNNIEVVLALNGSVMNFRYAEDLEDTVVPLTSIKTHDGKIALDGDHEIIKLDWFDGAEHIFLGEVHVGACRFRSDADFPLTFQLVKDAGYIYLCGRGTVHKEDGAAVTLGAKQAASDWLDPLANGTSLQKQGAAIALGYYRDKSAVPALIAATKDTSSWKVRRDATEALGRIGDPAAVQALAAVVTDENALVGPVALESLAKLGAPGLPHVKKYLPETEKKYRNAAIYALGASPAPEAVNILTEMVRNPKDSVIHKNAVNALAKIGKPPCLSVLIEVLKSSKDSGVRTAALQGVDKLAAPQDQNAILAALQEAAKDKDKDVRNAAESALAKRTKAN
jgi:hypothetical protein